MRKVFVYIGLLVLCACTKNFTTLNQDPNKFTVVAPEATIEAAVRSLNIQMSTYNYTKYWDIGNLIWVGSRYDVTDAGLWKTAYNNVLENLDQTITTYGSDSLYNNRVQIARILKWYTFSILVGQFGPIPVRQANNLNYLNTIAFDSEDSTYSYILDSLKDATTRIVPTGDKLSYDVVYNGNLTSWVHFANTLRLKIALRCMKNLNAAAVANIRDCMTNESSLIQSEAETAKMAYENVTNNQNPYWLFFINSNSYYPYSSTGHNIPPRMSEFMSVFMRSYSDPRMPVYFDSVTSHTARFQVTDTLPSIFDDSMRIVTYGVPFLGKPLSATYTSLLPNWSSSLTGQTNPLSGINDTAYSLVSDAVINNPVRPLIMLSYAECNFLKAEAAQLGFGGASTPQQYYQNGIAANFAYWGLSSNQLATYMAQPGVQWGTVNNNAYWDLLDLTNANIPDILHQIWAQEWMNYFPDQSFDAWCLQRRTRFFTFPPELNPGGNASYTSHTLWMDVPGRGSYPSNESALNPQGYNQGVADLALNPSNASLIVNNEYNPDIQLNFSKPNVVQDWNTFAPTGYDVRFLQKWYGPTFESLKAAALSAKFSYTLLSTYHP
ncbi:SusD/RagB family nutrient-binding outer membrane lipoprotein [Dinghuibacter silviterrae]|uniref:SusD-like starch-binding protein associating with outer membrane n=1 Tax=Dinghuibacter silviterrae TaxID=1539049 RepID=A0A4R8DVK5_9BACT|nr:SusD/RagB family nutrient-binding outer membrane lipoprotein [Dinghuibacter silviterrae]TDX02066.1 SusD-like starch-binding protein associating with outer membrane [Dinghuibacter silviterrae]